MATLSQKKSDNISDLNDGMHLLKH